MAGGAERGCWVGGSKRQKTGWGVDDNSVERKVLQRVNDKKKRGRHGEI